MWKIFHFQKRLENSAFGMYLVWDFSFAYGGRNDFSFKLLTWTPSVKETKYKDNELSATNIAKMETYFPSGTAHACEKNALEAKSQKLQ
jgi:hypothetical protein